MIFAVICAGGVGTRMGGKLPKQYMNIGEKPIILHTIEKFLVNDSFEKIIVLCPKAWVNHTEDVVRKCLKINDRIIVLEGGESRNDTIMNSISYIEREYGLDDDTVIVTHDSVRPFVTHRIIEENIEFTEKYGACDTVIPATDTIVESIDSIKISGIPERKNMYQGQTPQSFKAKKLKELYNSLTDNEKEILTDAAKIYVLKNEPIYLVNGEVFNIKITYPYDLQVAETLINMNYGSKE